MLGTPLYLEQHNIAHFNIPLKYVAHVYYYSISLTHEIQSVCVRMWFCSFPTFASSASSCRDIHSWQACHMFAVCICVQKNCGLRRGRQTQQGIQKVKWHAWMSDRRQPVGAKDMLLAKHIKHEELIPKCDSNTHHDSLFMDSDMEASLPLPWLFCASLICSFMRSSPHHVTRSWRSPSLVCRAALSAHVYDRTTWRVHSQGPSV